ncbi:COPI associated protein [Metschnikowia aff. pulcherrima]|uniref:COPI associated protein n=1 Tax=Metschnikowia aff. pulcherrima TaxID=2163413 RepID=A0A4P6XU47_9ASCO|nr:COPI associated protein [Metschnikowia aff. pulcherrima]
MILTAVYNWHLHNRIWCYNCSPCINGSSWFRLLASLLIFVVGLIFIVLEAIPSISPPENMNPEGISIGIQDENIV